MNDMIDKLSGIEQEASAIMDLANNRKKELAKEIADKTTAFDHQLETDTHQKITDLKQNLEAALHTGLASQKEETHKLLNQMDAYYHSNHETLAKQLFDAMVER